MLRERDERAVLAQDAALLAGDLGDGVAKILLVVERDVGDDGEQRLDDVGRVQPAAETDFQHQDAGVFAIEIQEGDGREPLEEAGQLGKAAVRKQLPAGLVYAGIDLGEVAVWNRFQHAVVRELNAFVHAYQMRAGVEAGSVARGRQDRGQGGRGRAFAVGAGDQDRWLPSGVIPERGAQQAHVGQIELSRRWTAGPTHRKLGAEGVEMVDGFGVDHAFILERISRRYARRQKQLPAG
jgi:hypothetical protein